MYTEVINTSMSASSAWTDYNAVWRPLRKAFPPSIPINFTNAEIVNYFVIRRAIDGLPASDVKGMNSSALNLFWCGHLQDIVFIVIL